MPSQIIDLTRATADTEAKVTCAPRELLTVVLTDVPSTGYTWALRSLPEGVWLLDVDHDPHRTRNDEGEFLVGTSAPVRFVFLVVDPSAGGEISLRRVRPWDPDGQGDLLIGVAVRPA